ncbi:MAG: hypothetical protein H8D45_26440 [Bacteroidetes bacterium]|nr:hypothetical protein [Bacteroidota bacterium]MBL7105126.1 hypothetical protein [Bacteroidales bacterium]
MKLLLTILLFYVFALTCFSQSRDIPYSIEDRDRLIRTEEKVNSLRNEMNALRNEMNAKFDSQQRQIDDLKTMFIWGFGILITLMLFSLGYIIWDRRTALTPMREKTQSVSEKVLILEKVLKEEAKSNIRLAEILRSYGIL